MGSTKPARRQGIVEQDIGEETLLYSTEGEAIHVLNHTAKLIWDLCDGTHSVEDMERAIREGFAVAAGLDVMGDVRQTLEVLAAKGLLEEPG